MSDPEKAGKKVPIPLSVVANFSNARVDVDVVVNDEAVIQDGGDKDAALEKLLKQRSTA